MKSSFSGFARLAAPTDHPIGNPELQGLSTQDLDEVLACFSEIDTESSQESNKIAYLEQMLRLQEPRHLSETQLSGRRFLLDMLSRLSQLPTGEQAQTVALKDWYPSHPYKYLIYLLERTGRHELSSTIQHAQGIQSFQESDLLALRQWMDQYGIAANEVALIQPNFFAVRSRDASGMEQKGIHPQFVPLVDSSRERSHDYAEEAFLGASEPLRLIQSPLQAAEMLNVESRGEVLASIYEQPFDQQADDKGRLKAFFVPNRSGEPLIGLSFMMID